MVKKHDKALTRKIAMNTKLILHFFVTIIALQIKASENLQPSPQKFNPSRLLEQMKLRSMQFADDCLAKASLSNQKEIVYTWNNFIQDWVIPTAGACMSVALASYYAPEDIAHWIADNALWATLGAVIAAHTLLPTAHPQTIKQRLFKGGLVSLLLCAGYGNWCALQQYSHYIHPEHHANTTAQLATAKSTIDQLEKAYQTALPKMQVAQQINQELSEKVDKQTCEIARLKYVIEELEQLYNNIQAGVT